MGHTRGEAEADPGRASGRDLPDAAYEAARRLDPGRKGMHYEEINEELLRSGAIIRGPSRGQTMSGALTGDPARFEQLGEGLWRWR